MFNRFAVLTTLSCAAVLSSTPHLHAQKSEVKNIVLVHGAWADGSGWRGVYDHLVEDGFNVTIVQEPETSFQDDVIAVKRVVALQDGPSLLVAHSYGTINPDLERFYAARANSHTIEVAGASYCVPTPGGSK
jgi:hypothetical protein